MYTILYNPLWISETNIVTDKAASALITCGKVFTSDGHYLYVDGTAIADFSGSQHWFMPELPPVRDFIRRIIGEKIKTIAVNKTISSVSDCFTEVATAFIQKRQASFEMIIGAGPGLTPSGDDMLTGFALAVLAMAPERLKDLEALCIPLLNTTTDISRQLLKNAFRGRFTAPLVTLLLSAEEDLDKNLESALNIGASSGRDGIFGLYTGLKLLN